jgi:hypothetical protein
MQFSRHLEVVGDERRKEVFRDAWIHSLLEVKELFCNMAWTIHRPCKDPTIIHVAVAGQET